MATTKIILSDNDEAILILPASLRTEQKELFIDKLGDDGFILFPDDDTLYPAKQTAETSPKDFLEERNDFIYKKIGDGYILYPANDPWFPLRLSIGQMPDDFMTDRDQPSCDEISEREPF